MKGSFSPVRFRAPHKVPKGQTLARGLPQHRVSAGGRAEGLGTYPPSLSGTTSRGGPNVIVRASRSKLVAMPAPSHQKVQDSAPPREASSSAPIDHPVQGLEAVSRPLRRSWHHLRHGLSPAQCPARRSPRLPRLARLPQARGTAARAVLHRSARRPGCPEAGPALARRGGRLSPAASEVQAALRTQQNGRDRRPPGRPAHAQRDPRPLLLRYLGGRYRTTSQALVLRRQVRSGPRPQPRGQDPPGCPRPAPSPRQSKRAPAAEDRLLSDLEPRQS